MDVGGGRKASSFVQDEGERGDGVRLCGGTQGLSAPLKCVSGEEERPALLPKTKGSEVMVSDFVEEHKGYLRLSNVLFHGRMWL